MAERADQRARNERQAEIARDKGLESLSERQEQAWRQVGLHIDSKRPSEYDAAVRILQDLRAVGERQDRAEAFDRRLTEVRLQHRRKPSLLQRLDEAGLTGRAR